MKKKLLMLIVAASAVLLAVSAAADPRVILMPKLLVKPADSVTLRWDDGTALNPASPVYLPVSTTCRVIFGTSPGSYPNQVNASLTTNQQAVFTPQAEGMAGGVYYCRVSNVSADQISSEFTLMVESPDAPAQVFPANGAAINDLLPVFQWQAVPGVPYYTIGVFDTNAVIDISSGSLSITADVIWAATTDLTSIQYGAPDPSGYYDKLNPPPLMQGLTYTWIVLNNYSSSPAMISQSFAGAKSFTVNPASACSQPVPVSPTGGAAVSVQPVTLSWTAATGANNYMVHLLKKEGAVSDKMSGSGSIPVWSGYTNQNYIEVPANIGMSDTDYSWYVIALDATGKGKRSVNADFYFQTSTAHVTMNIREFYQPTGVTSVPRVMLYIETLTGGNFNSYPYTTDNNGLSFYIPMGDYKVTVKKDGYVTATFTASVPNTADRTFNFNIARSPYTVRGFVKDTVSGVPVQGARLTAGYLGEVSEAMSGADGSFVLYASALSSWAVSVDKTGYDARTFTASVTGRDNSAGNIFITKSLNILSGSVTNASAQGISGALVYVADSGNPSVNFSVLTNVNGDYSVNLPDGDFTVNVTKAGFSSPPPASISVSGGQSRTRNFTLTEQACQVSGNVTLNGSQPFENVLVRAISPVSGTAAETLTDAFGTYSLSMQKGLYGIYAIKDGYSSGGVQWVTFTAGGQSETGVDFDMNPLPIPDNAAIWVHSHSGASDLADASVFFEGSNTFTAGYSATLSTGSPARVTITAIREGYYTVMVMKPGYTPLVFSNVLTNNGSVTYIDADMPATPPTYGILAGAVKTSANAAVPGAVIKVYDIAVPDTAFMTVVSDGTGAFGNTLPTGSYTIRAEKDGYTSSPVQLYAVMVAPNTVTAQFTMDAVASGGGVVVNPPVTKVYNENIGGPYKFTASFKDGSGKVIDTGISWSIRPPQAGSIGSNGILTPTANYIGEAVLAASARGQSTEITVPVYQRIDETYGALSLTDYEGFSLSIPAGAAKAANTVKEFTMRRLDITRARAVSESRNAVGKAYELSTGVGFSQNVTLSLPLPGLYDIKSAVIGAWEESSLKWLPVSGSVMGASSVSAQVGHFSQYAVLTDLKGLSEGFATFNPNPFSPYNGPLRIGYSLNSDRTPEVETTIKVFNIKGDLVRVIIEKALRPVGMIINDYWDGKDESGKWARNGRYVIEIRIKDSTGEQRYLHMVALIK